MGQGSMTETGKQTSSMQLPQWLQDEFQRVVQVGQGSPTQLGDYAPGFSAPSNPYLTQGLQNAGNLRAPDYTTVRNVLGEQAGVAGSQVRNPYDVNITQNYNPTAYNPQSFTGQNVQFQDTLAGYNPNIQAFQGQAAQVAGHGFSAQDYNFTPDKVSAERLGPFERVQAERIQNPAAFVQSFQMGPQQQVIAPWLQQHQMQGPADVASRDVTAQQVATPADVVAQQVAAQNVATNAWTDAGVRDKYMDPYMADVVAKQQANAQRIFDEQRAQAGGQAAAAGAFGGSRQAVLESAMRRDLANQQGTIAAEGLQSAYTNAQQQYERDRGASIQTQLANQQSQLQAALANQQSGLQAGLANQQMGFESGRLNAANDLQSQLANQQYGLQAALANQQMGFNVGQTNLQALLSQQELGAQQGLRAQELNQNVNLQRDLANQQAALQAQGLGVNTSLQSQLANQQYGLQAALANQGAGIDIGKANQAAALQAALANQQTGLDAQIRGAELGQSDRQFLGQLNQQRNISNAELQQQMGLANLQNQMSAQELGANLGFDALKTRYQGGLQAGLANQQHALDAWRASEQARQFGADLGQRQTEFGADLNYKTQMGQQQAMNDIIRSNLAATQLSGDLWNQWGQFEGRGFDQSLAANAQLLNAGFGQAGLDQQSQQMAYQHWMAQQQYPMQYAAMQMGLLNPMVGAFGTQNSTSYQRGPSLLSQIAGLGVAGIGAMGGLGTGGLGLFGR